ncbi:ThuA domain-containing protein [Novosphingobium sediminicola]|uniref:ThuA-like domain-containing protein n=1 Tax=Novosphingobium sediminicola TaxID=563162 RepID=A0A7W6CEP3_9SPHN|nr:ThuA domain-containing protein [Novosphingobium sediminicola]MBB3954452.1 hypothetical protein [Novosphingobium sediminicola]
MRKMFLLAGLLPAVALAQIPPAQSPAAPPPMMPQSSVNDPWPGMKKLLIIADVQTGWHHDSINHAMGVIEQMGREHGEWATVIRTDSQLITKAPIVGQGTRYAGKPVNARNLDQFDAVFYLGSGAGALSDQQKADLLSFVKQDGKGFIAGHAATVAYYEWPEFTQMIGAFMESEFRVDTMQIINEDPTFPGAGVFPKSFAYTDQFPVMRMPFSSKDAHVILRLDPSKMTPQQRKTRADDDFPLVWAKSYGKGRVYNLTIGHQEQVWDDPKFREMAHQGIRWALGLVDAKVDPPAPPALPRSKGK